MDHQTFQESLQHYDQISKQEERRNSEETDTHREIKKKKEKKNNLKISMVNILRCIKADILPKIRANIDRQVDRYKNIDCKGLL